MGACLQTILSFIVLFILFLPDLLISSEAKKCPNYYHCNKNLFAPVIHFPFSAKAGPRGTEGCGYPGFQLTCDSTRNETILNLPFSGEFFVQNIYYETQRIRVGDPDECLPRRYLSNLNLSGTPFKSETYQNYTFCNCSVSGYLNLSRIYMNMSSSQMFLPINCLSSSTHTVLATVSTNLNVIRSMNRSCELIATAVSVPIERKWFLRGVIYALIVSDLYLTWDPPPQTSTKPRRLSKFNIIAICTSCGVVICFIWCARYGLKQAAYDANDQNHPSHVELSLTVRPPQSTTGLDESIVRSYPEMILSESRRFPSPENTTCAICLSDYQLKDTLKILPQCSHSFHVDCIVDWLRLNGTCPVCRNSPIHTLLPIPATS